LIHAYFGIRKKKELDMNRLHEGRASDKALPRAVVKKARPAWLLWLIPLAAGLLCVWFIYRDFVASGPLITIYFQNTEGLQEENTSVEYLGAQIGEVKTIGLAKDGQRVEVRARLKGAARNIAREGSVFWIVRPEVKVGAISGLRTIVSGEYVTVQPGHGAPTNVFVAVEEPPPTEEAGALLINIRSPGLGSLEKKSPIFYRGIQVGEVLNYQLAGDARNVMIRARISQQYAPLVRVNSKFWNAGGIDVRLGLFKGAEISAQSAQTLLGGGIEFATPPEMAETPSNGMVFDLNDKPKDAWKDWAPSIPLHLREEPPSSTFSAAQSKLQLQR
jgi:paraquat-inducible protein B